MAKKNFQERNWKMTVKRLNFKELLALQVATSANSKGDSWKSNQVTSEASTSPSQLETAIEPNSSEHGSLKCWIIHGNSEAQKSSH